MSPPFTDRFFNTAGPVKAGWHYLIDPLTRWDMDEILRLIAQGKYFVLHAPRQTGKTSCLLALMDYLNQASDYRAVYANLEAAQAVRGDLQQSIPSICQSIANSAARSLNAPEIQALPHRSNKKGCADNSAQPWQSKQ